MADHIPDWSSGLLEIDLDAVAANFRLVQTCAAPAEVGAVVKADAYGLGVHPIVATLGAAGCRHFFVAHLEEALAIRRRTPRGSVVYVLNGLWPGSEPCAAEAEVVPVLNSRRQVAAWQDLAAARGSQLPAVLQLDTGMSRLGLGEAEVDELAAAPEALRGLDLRYIMTHLACADQPAAGANEAQLQRFRRLAALLPVRPASIANSAAVLTGRGGVAGDLVRAGLALYGGAPLSTGANPLRPVVRVTARILQVREAPQGCGVGYGLTHVTPRPARIATVAAGYADGWPRSLGNRGAVCWRGHRFPIVGRVSMDSMMVDVTDASPDGPDEGDAVELVGPQQSLEAVAEAADTISYEILTRLGRRYRRTYAAIAPEEAAP